MIDTAGFVKLRQQLADWSDKHLDEACAFVKIYAAVIPRELGNSQLHGLANLARNAREYKLLADFLDNQANKAKRAGRVKMQECWQALKVKFDSFRGEAEQLVQNLRGVQSVDEIHRRLVLFFVQHLIAESLTMSNK